MDAAMTASAHIVMNSEDMMLHCHDWSDNPPTAIVDILTIRANTNWVTTRKEQKMRRAFLREKAYSLNTKKACVQNGMGALNRTPMLVVGASPSICGRWKKSVTTVCHTPTMRSAKCAVSQMLPELLISSCLLETAYSIRTSARVHNHTGRQKAQAK